jgi:UDP-N-acetylmuramoyl-L-alanyl-D-glutamate--2,6-diaminopimelate ligase
VSGSSDDVRVVIDYAHTDDALKNLLETARPLAQGRLVTVSAAAAIAIDQAPAHGRGGCSAE